MLVLPGEGCGKPFDEVIIGVVVRKALGSYMSSRRVGAGPAEEALPSCTRTQKAS